ncbi:MAG: MFS transporter [Alphaproteobacteria bacterium]|nr:MFS transporter [Alphaproteobacteria bacterium]
MKKFKFNRLILSTSAGHILEYYDTTLYGFFAVLLAPMFFPAENPAIATICSFIVFAAGFAMRPFGGIVFGHLGDKYGRKVAFMLSIALVTIPTLGIGCLPSYSTIGLAAPILLILFRLLQGISVGGEYGGAAIFIREHVKKEQAGFAGSMLATLGFVGALVGTLLGRYIHKN